MSAAVIFVAIQACAFALIFHGQFAALDALDEQIEAAKIRYVNNNGYALNRAAYDAQVRELDRRLGRVRRELPDRIDASFSSAQALARAHGLRIVQVEVAADEIRRTFYAERMARLEIAGRFHSVGSFMAGLARLPGSLELAAFMLERSAVPGEVILKCEVRAYRYISNAELERPRKSGGRRST